MKATKTSEATLSVEQVEVQAPTIPNGGATAQQRAPVVSIVEMLERVIVNPEISIERLEQAVALHERMIARDAKQQFSAAMAACQADMSPIAADASNKQTSSKYATYAQLDRALRPIYTRHGFSLSFDTADCPIDQHVRVVCYVEHVAGHSRTHHLDIPADGKGAKGGDVMTKTHATGSATSYGMRYLLKMIFNVAVGEADDDGNAAGAAQQNQGRQYLSQMQFDALMKECDLYNPPERSHEYLRNKFGVTDVTELPPEFFDQAVAAVRAAVTKQQGARQ